MFGEKKMSEINLTDQIPEKEFRKSKKLDLTPKNKRNIWSRLRSYLRG